MATPDWSPKPLHSSTMLSNLSRASSDNQSNLSFSRWLIRFDIFIQVCIFQAICGFPFFHLHINLICHSGVKFHLLLTPTPLDFKLSSWRLHCLGRQHKGQDFIVLQISVYHTCLSCRCGHCKKLAPEYEVAATRLKGIVGLAKVLQSLNAPYILTFWSEKVVCVIHSFTLM